MKPNSGKWLALAILSITAALLLGLFLALPRDDSFARIRRNGVLRIGYAIEAPYLFLDAAGKLTGLEYETAQAVAGQLGILRLEWIQTEFGSLLPELETGRFDVVVAGMFITPDRARQARFSEPTLHVRQALLVETGNPHNLHSYSDLLQNPQVKTAVLRGAVEAELLRQLGVPETRLIFVPDALTGRVAVESGLAGALALSLPTVQLMAQQQSLGRSEIAQPFSQPDLPGGRPTGFVAVAFRKADDDVRVAWNRQLSQFIGSAEHRHLLARFGLSAEDLPGNVTTDAILATETP